MNTCPKCGYENKPGSKFCMKCGNPLEAPREETQPAQQAGEAGQQPPVQQPPTAAPQQPAAPPPQAAPTAGPAPGGPAQPGAAAPPGYTPRPAGPGYPTAPAAYAAPGRSRGALFWIGASVIVLAGILILLSTFMPWITGPYGVVSFSGWDSVVNEQIKISNAFFEYAGGYPFFSGLCSLLAGVIIALLGVIMLLTRNKGSGVVAIIFSIIALGIAITNMSSVLRDPGGFGMGVGAGIYVFLIFSLLGIVGGGMAMSG